MVKVCPKVNPFERGYASTITFFFPQGPFLKLHLLPCLAPFPVQTAYVCQLRDKRTILSIYPNPPKKVLKSLFLFCIFVCILFYFFFALRWKGKSIGFVYFIFFCTIFLFCCLFGLLCCCRF